MTTTTEAKQSRKPRVVLVGFKVDVDERAALDECARVLGLTLSEFARRVLLPAARGVVAPDVDGR